MEEENEKRMEEKRKRRVRKERERMREGKGAVSLILNHTFTVIITGH